EKQSCVAPDEIDSVKSGAAGRLYDAWGRIDSLAEDKGLGIQASRVFVDGRENMAVYLDLDAGDFNAAMRKLTDACRGPREEHGAYRFSMLPYGFESDRALAGTDASGKQHVIVPVMFASSAVIKAQPMQVAYAAAAAADDAHEPGRRWCDLAYSKPVKDAAAQAAPSRRFSRSERDVRDAVHESAKEDVAEKFGLTGVRWAEPQEVRQHMPHSEPSPSAKLVIRKAGQLYDTLRDFKDTLGRGGSVPEGGSWTDVKGAGGRGLVG
ncbi:MAG: hypothetical protein NC311_15685, partial [Muribaculaceae bacterium]|nr:hypothetical protein [Muribaculaceae bacterium]